MNLFEKYKISDVVSCKNHSNDFNGMRTEFMVSRIRIMSLMFSILAILWVAVDINFFSGEKLVNIILLRLLVGGAFFLLWLRSTHSYKLIDAYKEISMFLVLASVFYFFSTQIISSSDLQTAMISGYYFVPFFLVTMMAIFPMTLVEAITCFIFVGLVYFIHEIYFGYIGNVYSIGDAWLLASMSAIIISSQLTQLHMLLRLYREASNDVLTSLANRRVLMKWIDKEIEYAVDKDKKLSILMFDIDYFKRLNDVHGHLVGDEVLRNLGSYLNDVVRNHGLVGRYGGEEFLVVLPNNTKQDALYMAEKIRNGIKELEIQVSENEKIHITVSIGVAELHDNESQNELLQRVDNLLYNAKDSGRDFVAS